MTFLLSEDKALREKLSGMVVHDQKATGDNEPRQVGVWFGQPDPEIRAQSYPYITINMIDVQRDMTREMRGVTSAEYLRPAALGENDVFSMDRPVPVNLDYQITTYARHPRHDRELISQLMSSVLPVRFGILEVDDNTVRRLDVLEMTKRDVTEQAKRLFVNAITVRISSEIVPNVYKQLHEVLAVHVDDPSNPDYIGPGSFTISS